MLMVGVGGSSSEKPMIVHMKPCEKELHGEHLHLPNPLQSLRPCLSIFWFACLTGTWLYYREGRREDCLYMDESVELDSEVKISIASREWLT